MLNTKCNLFNFQQILELTKNGLRSNVNDLKILVKLLFFKICAVHLDEKKNRNYFAVWLKKGTFHDHSISSNTVSDTWHKSISKINPFTNILRGKLVF